ncbi:hypothetical protein GA0061098_100739 [Bradyrhizobium shewense]|uniref:Uncharacterized protein n=1 Tax=Bradyrhizobium shewense TaxID=1761772 RepID=A0A1C3WA50_9BRAD|nr:hypothetical protein GA0061098_100739 [Bradyrhizobium shewense]
MIAPNTAPPSNTAFWAQTIDPSSFRGSTTNLFGKVVITMDAWVERGGRLELAPIRNRRNPVG